MLAGVGTAFALGGREALQLRAISRAVLGMSAMQEAPGDTLTIV